MAVAFKETRGMISMANDKFAAYGERNVIMLVDDDITNLKSGKNALIQFYDVITAPGADRMFALLEKNRPDLILLDISMPDMDGHTALKILKENPETAKIPVIFLTGKIDAESEVLGFELGAIDFIHKPFTPAVLRTRIAMHLNVDKLVAMRTAQLEKLQNGIVSVIAELVEGRDEVTGKHIENTRNYLEQLLLAMLENDCYRDEISAWNTDVVLSASQLHDVGKISISDVILNKPGKLTSDEYEAMKYHTVFGETIVDRVVEKTGESDYLTHARVFAGSHHERWDGTGYPRGLRENQIPLQGRIMAVIDVYDALVSVRPYKRAYSHSESVNIILNGAGTHFDPKIAEIFLMVTH
jgi:putative two-component system response regulator